MKLAHYNPYRRSYRERYRGNRGDYVKESEIKFSYPEDSSIKLRNLVDSTALRSFIALCLNKTKRSKDTELGHEWMLHAATLNWGRDFHDLSRRNIKKGLLEIPSFVAKPTGSVAPFSASVWGFFAVRLDFWGCGCSAAEQRHLLAGRVLLPRVGDWKRKRSFGKREDGVGAKHDAMSQLQSLLMGAGTEMVDRAVWGFSDKASLLSHFEYIHREATGRKECSGVYEISLTLKSK